MVLGVVAGLKNGELVMAGVVEGDYRLQLGIIIHIQYSLNVITHFKGFVVVQ